MLGAAAVLFILRDMLRNRRRMGRGCRNWECSRYISKNSGYNVACIESQRKFVFVCFGWLDCNVEPLMKYLLICFLISKLHFLNLFYRSCFKEMWNDLWKDSAFTHYMKKCHFCKNCTESNNPEVQAESGNTQIIYLCDLVQMTVRLWWEEHVCNVVLYIMGMTKSKFINKCGWFFLI